MVGVRARSNAPYYLLNEDAMQFTTTNWYSLIVELDTTDQTATGIEATPANSTKAEKILRNGQLLIRHNGTLYNALGGSIEK
jgi:hypothetical protein